MQKNILILGGGYAGLACTMGLEKRLKNEIIAGKVKLTLINKHDYHYQTTLLHRIALGTYSERKGRIFYRKILHNTNFIKDIVTDIDLNARKIYGVNGCHEYDYLVIALGFEPNFMGISGAKEHTYKLATMNSALELLHDLEMKFKNFSPKSSPQDLHFAVVGSGFTGVEYAAELKDRIDELCDICGIDRSLGKIYLIARGGKVLPMFSKKLSNLSRKKLTKRGIEIINGSVIECFDGGVIVENEGKKEKILANTVLWSAGVKGNEIINKLSTQNVSVKNSRIMVDACLRVENFDNVFALGDCAMACEQDIVHAPTAQLATQMGEYCSKSLAKIIQAEIKGDKNACQIKPFKFHHKGTVCSIGHTDAVGFAFGVGIAGEVAAFLKNFIENKWLYAIGGPAMVIKKGQFRFRSSD